MPLICLLILILAPPLYWRVVRPWFNRWGATVQERRRDLPGDALVPDPQLGYTRAITINAPPDAIWPWLVQIGYQRAGWYSYDSLERLVGAADFVDGHRSSKRIVPELQDLQPGDVIRIGADPAPAFTVREAVPNSHLLLHGDGDPEAGDPAMITWLFFLDPRSNQATRLIVRERLAFKPTLGNRLLWHMIEFWNFVMERKMLKGIRARVEDHA